MLLFEVRKMGLKKETKNKKCGWRDSNSQGKATRPSNVRVYQFRHIRSSLLYIAYRILNSLDCKARDFCSIVGVPAIFIRLTQQIPRLNPFATWYGLIFPKTRVNSRGRRILPKSLLVGFKVFY